MVLYAGVSYWPLQDATAGTPWHRFVVRCHETVHEEGLPIREPPASRAALGTFAIGTASFVFAGLLGDVAGNLSVSAGTAGQLVTSYAVVYAVGSPILVTFTSGIARRRLLVFALAVFVEANVAAVVIPSIRPLLASRVVAVCGAAASLTAIGLGSSFIVLAYLGLLLEDLTGYGGGASARCS